MGPAFVFEADGELWGAPEGGSCADWELLAILKGVGRLSALDIPLI